MRNNQYFLTGSIFGHIFSMAHTSMFALISVVLVDALDMVFLGMLGKVEIIAALGFAWPVVFFTLAVSLGISTSMTALVSRAEGLGDRERAGIYATHVMVVGVGIAAVMTGVIWLLAPVLLHLFGARGAVLQIGVTYLHILVLCLPVLVISMSSGALLRAVGARKRAMWAKIAGAGTNAVLDPICIFGLGWGVEGAAWATVLSRVVIMSVAFWGAYRVYGLIGTFNWRLFKADAREIIKIAIPVSIAKAGPPAGSAFLMATMAQFGDHAVAAVAIIERIAPFAFVGLYALPQAIGPIIGQNFAAGHLDRVRMVWRDALILAAIYVTGVFAILFVAQDGLAAIFKAPPQTAYYLSIFCCFTAPFYLFQGVQFVAHTAFNVTGRPMMAMVFDLARETLGVMPFVYLGAMWFGGVGVLAGQVTGMVVFGALSALVCYGLMQGQNASPVTDGDKAKSNAETQPA